MKSFKNIFTAVIVATFVYSCVPRPGQRPMPPGHDKKVQELKERHPGNR